MGKMGDIPNCIRVHANGNIHRINIKSSTTCKDIEEILKKKYREGEYHLCIKDKPLNKDEIVYTRVANGDKFNFLKFSSQKSGSQIIVEKKRKQFTLKNLSRFYPNSSQEILKYPKSSSIRDVNAIIHKNYEKRNIEIICKIGSGSSCTVYSCFVDDWICAMKEIKLSSKELIQYSNGISKEIQILENLPNHPNVIRYLFHEIGNDYCRIYFKQYQLSLYDEIQERKLNNNPFSFDEIHYILDQVCCGLKFLHTNNIIHRDIKSQNIFVKKTLNSCVYVIGDLDSATNIQRPSSIIGTPCFMAPEVLTSEGENKYSYSADIFSFGMLIFELVTLSLPYMEVKSFLVADNIIKGIPPSLSEYTIPDSYKSLVELHLLCIQCNPELRPSMKVINAIISLQLSTNESQK